MEEESAAPDPEALAAYVERLFASEDETLQALREEIVGRGMPEIYISPEEGRLLQVLLVAVGARHVLEIGTLGGYSTIWMARALPADGRVTTLELEEARALLAREFARRAGLEHMIEVRVGVAAASLEEIAAEGHSFDACFIDADKVSYPAYLEWAERLVRPGGLILGDNAFLDGRVLQESPPDDDTLAMQQFNTRLAANDNLCSTILQVRDGLGVAVVRGQAG